MTQHARRLFRDRLPLLFVSLAVGLLVATPPAPAQDNPAPQKPDKRKFGGRLPLGDLEKRLGQIDPELVKQLQKRLEDLGVGGLLGRGARLAPEQMLDRLMTFDKNKDGKITADELPERMRHLVAKGDLDNDRALNKEEIQKLAATLAKQPGANDTNGSDFLTWYRELIQQRLGSRGGRFDSAALDRLRQRLGQRQAP